MCIRDRQGTECFLTLGSLFCCSLYNSLQAEGPNSIRLSGTTLKEMIMLQRNVFTGAATFVVALTFAGIASAQTCATLPSHAKLKAALVQATKDETSGLNNHMWATIVDRDGVVCAVAFSGTDRFSQWPGSRVISAQKANTANSFSLDSTSSISGSGTAFAPLASPVGLALSTANLYAAVQ